ncbi:hemolysin family protein [Kineococcus sp. NUM-3379]
MGAPLVPLLLAAFVLVVLAGALAAAEAAVASTPRRRARELVADGRRGAHALETVLETPATTLTVSTLLRVMAETGAAVLVTVAVAGVTDSWWQVLLLAALGMGVVDFILVGVGPRTLGRLHSEQVALATAPLLGPLTRWLGPLAGVLVRIGGAVTPGGTMQHGPFGTEAELRELVDIAGETSLIEADEREMIHSVFELGDTLAREVMVPRTDLVTVRRDTGLEEVLSLLLRSGFSRVPVVGEGGTDDILGIAYLKDLVRALHGHPPADPATPVEQIARPAVFVPDSLPVDTLMKQMQRGSTHVAVVVDEYGGTAGLVTMEDVLEEIVGDIADEYDRNVPEVEPLDDDGYRVSARLHVEELGDLFELHIEDEEVDTVGGLLAKALGEVPIPGSRALAHGLELVADRRGGRRNQVVTILVHRFEEDEEDPVGPDGQEEGTHGAHRAEDPRREGTEDTRRGTARRERHTEKEARRG